MAWRNWFKGLVAAVVGGTCTSITVAIVDPLTFNLQAGIGNLAKVMIVSAIFNGAFYLKDHPVPDVESKSVP